VEVGKAAPEQECSAVDARQAKLAVVKATAHMIVIDPRERVNEVVELLIGRVVLVGFQRDQSAFACFFEVDLVLDQVVIAPHETHRGTVHIIVGLLEVLPECLGVEIGRDGLDEDALVVPHQMEPGVLVDHDLAGMRLLVVQGHDVPERRRLHLQHGSVVSALSLKQPPGEGMKPTKM